MHRLLWACLVLSLSSPAAARTTTEEHLLAAVGAFRAGDYDAALIELRVVERASDAPPDLAFYLGPTLYKLGRYREALATFLASPAPPDALTEFYLGQTYYQLRLYRKSLQVFTALRGRGLGPKLAAAAEKYEHAVEATFAAAPPEGAVDFYLAAGRALLPGEPRLAAEYLDEARLVATLTSSERLYADALAALGAAWNACGRPDAVIALLRDGPSSSASQRELARAYVAVGDHARARPLLERLAASGGELAPEARALLLHLGGR
jgi:hypothetical protein